jgi:manganese/iron transport system permease protein/iron/zinc/copper transport system permease protein
VISEFIHFFLIPLQETYFQKALIAGSTVAIACGVVGCLVILNRMAFLGDALSHAMLAGVAGGYLFMQFVFGVEAHSLAMIIGSLVAALLAVTLVNFVSLVPRIKEDTAIGIMYSSTFSLGLVIISLFINRIHISISQFIMGDILSIADADLWATTFVCCLVLSFICIFFRYFQIASFDPVMAASIGVPLGLIQSSLTAGVALIVVTGINMVGVILIMGFLITPAATAYLICDRLARLMILAALFGVTSVLVGLYLSLIINAAAGATIMLFASLQFLVVLIVAPKYGLLARWRNSPVGPPRKVLKRFVKSV